MPRLSTGGLKRVHPDCGEPPQSSAQPVSAGNVNLASTPSSGLYHDSTTSIPSTVAADETDANDGIVPQSESARNNADAAHIGVRGGTEGADGSSHEGTYGIAQLAPFVCYFLELGHRVHLLRYDVCVTWLMCNLCKPVPSVCTFSLQ